MLLNAALFFEGHGNFPANELCFTNQMIGEVEQSARALTDDMQFGVHTASGATDESSPACLPDRSRQNLAKGGRRFGGGGHLRQNIKQNTKIKPADFRHERGTNGGRSSQAP